VGIEHLPIIIGLRRGAVNTGTWEDDYGGKLFNQLERGSNALGIGALERDKFIQKQGFPIFDGTQEYCLWLGCMGAYDPKGREIVTAFAQVMNFLGTSFGVLKKEKCTGDPVRRLGNDLVFQTLAEENLKNLAQNKVKKIVSICPHCVRTIQEDWRRTALRRKSSIILNSWLVTRIGCRNRPLTRRWCITIRATWGGIAMCMSSRGSWCRSRLSSSKLRATRNAASVVGREAGWCFWARRRVIA
jgi:Fe-S oxidoreductase